MTNLVLSAFASVCLTDNVDCIVQELENRGAAVQLFFPGQAQGYPALAKARLRMFQPDGQQYLRQWMSYRAERWLEGRYRQIFRKTGLLVAEPNNVSSLFEKASRHVSPAIFGEIIPSVGKGLEAAEEGSDLKIIGVNRREH